mmetsp:Transcript_21331/g.52157  ORF Transcript_21331/g.52157 Transcript_21331/m.52157 type:complete len:85 (-) Transcript_21331:66-320(-)
MFGEVTGGGSEGKICPLRRKLPLQLWRACPYNTFSLSVEGQGTHREIFKYTPQTQWLKLYELSIWCPFGQEDKHGGTQSGKREI